MKNPVAVPFGRFGFRAELVTTRPDEQVDNMIRSPINHRSNQPAGNIVEATAFERKARLFEVFDRRVEVDATIKPWPHGMAIGRDYVLQRAYMPGNNLLYQALFTGRQHEKG